MTTASELVAALRANLARTPIHRLVSNPSEPYGEAAPCNGPGSISGRSTAIMPGAWCRGCADVEVVAYDHIGDRYILILVETRPWSEGGAQLRQLRDKIENYTSFVLNGSLVRTYPAAEGKRVAFQLDCLSPPTGEIADLLAGLARSLDRLGIGFEINVVGLRGMPV